MSMLEYCAYVCEYNKHHLIGVRQRKKTITTIRQRSYLTFLPRFRANTISGAREIDEVEAAMLLPLFDVRGLPLVNARGLFGAENKKKKHRKIFYNIRKVINKTPSKRGTAAIPLLCLSHEKGTTHWTPSK